jgi:outer membrane protein insertion porin family
MRGASGGLLIRVKEGNTSTFDGVIGYLPATAAGEGGYFTGLASISMRNLFGTGRKLSVQWQREDKQSQELGLRYLEPWVFNIPANLTGGFFQRQQDTSYIRRVIDVKGELMLSDELSIALTLGSENVIPSLDTTVNRVFKSSTITLGLELQLDTRDDIYSPTRGAHYLTDYQYGKKSTSNVPDALVSHVPARANTQKITLDMDFFQSTFSHQVAAVGFHGRELQSGQLEESEMFRFGGAKTLRGYRENQFLGSRVAWSNFEYRFLLARRSFFYGFIDAGYYSRPADELRAIPKSEAFKYGYGIGIQFESGLGNLGVSFALGQGDTFTQGKIHVGLINEF